MLLQQRQREPVQPREVLAQMPFAEPGFVLAECHVQDPVTAVLDEPGTIPSKEQVVCEVGPAPRVQGGTDVIIRVVAPVSSVRPTDLDGSTFVGTPSTLASGPVRSRLPTPPTGRHGRRPGGREASPSSATRAPCAGIPPGPAPGRVTSARPGTGPRPAWASASRAAAVPVRATTAAPSRP